MAVTKKKRITAKSMRRKTSADLNPKWEGHADWDDLKFDKFFQDAMRYYRIDVPKKNYKDLLVNWMTAEKYSRESISAVKNCAAHKVNATVAGVAACLSHGMPAVREGFNEGRDTKAWLSEKVDVLIADQADQLQETSTQESPAATARTVSVHDRVKQAAVTMAADIEDIYESFLENPKSFKPKAVNVVNLLKAKMAKAPHARIIKEFYQRDIEEIRAAIQGQDEDLKEAYGHLTKAQLKKFLEFLLEVDGACDMLIQEGKVSRKPKAKKAKPVEKIVEKLTFKKADPDLKLVSINPADIVGATELWVYNTKTRKIGKYVAEETASLSVKGTTITDFDNTKSIQKTLRKPQEQLTQFKACNKVALRKYLDSIKAVDIKLNGRVNADTILLKVF